MTLQETPTMAPEMSASVNTPVASESQNATRLVAGILDDASKLLMQHVELFRAEVREDFKRTVTAAKYLGAGSALVLVGALFLAVSLVPLIGELAPSLPPWSRWAIVGGVFVVAGGIAFAIGRSVMRSFNPLPDQTLAAIREDVSWISKPQP
jgi:hypothetical protein